MMCSHELSGTLVPCPRPLRRDWSHVLCASGNLSSVAVACSSNSNAASRAMLSTAVPGAKPNAATRDDVGSCSQVCPRETQHCVSPSCTRGLLSMLILPARNGAARPRIFMQSLSSPSKPLGELEVAPGKPCMHYSFRVSLQRMRHVRIRARPCKSRVAVKRMYGAFE